MRLRLITGLISFAFAAACFGAPTIELELATESGVQITAPQEWLQLLRGIGIENVRIRGAKPGDVPTATNRGSEDRPVYEVLGVLTRRDQLQLTTGSFSRADRAKIKDYFEQLAADGAESLTAPRGMFGLAEKEIKAVFADLAQPINFETRQLPPRAVLEKLQTRLASKIELDTNAERVLRDAKPMADELKGMSHGTGMAIMLRASGLVLQPVKERGQPVVYRIGPAHAFASAPPERAGKTDDLDITNWPMGWEPHDAPGRAAPSLFTTLNAEVDGYSLAELLAAVSPRLKIPVYVDHATLAAQKIDPAKVQVRLPKTRASYKRVIDRALAQARFGSQVRIDEAGNAFLWITR